MVEELADLLGGAVGALVLGGHPHLGRFLDDLLADRVHPGLHQLDRARPGGAGGGFRGQLGEQLLERLGRAAARGRRGRRGGGAVHFSPNDLRASAVATALRAASRPLSSADPGSPARSRACCSVSQVRTPNPTGMPDSTATRVSPSVAAAQTYSKWGVPPRMTTPSATIAS